MRFAAPEKGRERAVMQELYKIVKGLEGIKVKRFSDLG